MRLALENLLFDRSRGNESVDKAVFLLPVTPDTGQRLLISGWVPVWIEQDESVGTDEVETTSTGLTTEKKHKLFAIRVIELIHKLRSLFDVHCSIQSQTPISPGSAESLEQIKSLGVVADQYNLIIGVLADSCKHAVEHHHFSRVPALDVSVTTTRLWGCKVFGECVLATWQVFCQVQKIWVVAKFLQNSDRLQRLTTLPSQQTSNLGTLNEVVVEIQLEL